MSAPASIATFSEEHAVELLARLRRAAPDAIIDAELVVALLPHRREGSRWEPAMAARLADPTQGPAFVHALVALAEQLGRREARAAEVIAAAEAACDELTELAKQVTDHPLYFEVQADAIEALGCFTDELAADLARARALGEGDLTLVRALADQVLRLEGTQGVRLIEADMEISRLRQLLDDYAADLRRVERLRLHAADELERTAGELAQLRGQLDSTDATAAVPGHPVVGAPGDPVDPVLVSRRGSRWAPVLDELERRARTGDFDQWIVAVQQCPPDDAQKHRYSLRGAAKSRGLSVQTRTLAPRADVVGIVVRARRPDERRARRAR